MVGVASEQARARLAARAARTGERLVMIGRRPALVLVPLIVVQWLVVAVFVTTVQRNGWLFYQGGDETWFYTSAWVLAHGNLPETFISYAWPIVLAPIAALRGANFLAALPAIVLLQAVVLLPSALLAVYAIAARIGGRILGYWAAALWIVAPFAAIPLFVDRYHEKFVEQFLPQAFGLTGLGDYPSMVAVLGAAYFAVRALDTHEWADAVAAGLVTGLAIGIKPANGLFAVAPLVTFVLARHWRLCASFGVALLPALATLALWKYRGTGIAVLAFDEVRLAAGEMQPHPSELSAWEQAKEYVPLDLEQLRHQFIGFREFFWSVRVLECLPLAGAIAVARVSVVKAAFLAIWLAAFFLVKGSSPAVSVEAGTIWRLLMPAWPAYFLLVAAIPLLVPVWGRRLAGTVTQVATTPLRWRNPAALAGAAALVAIPFAVVATFPPSSGATAAKLPLNDLFVPERDLGLTASVTGRTVRLEWRRPRAAGAAAFSVVLRAPLDEEISGQHAHAGRLCQPTRGTPRCTFEMKEVIRTRNTALLDRPGPGRWTYRVGYAANWRDDMTQGDILLVSLPVVVSVP